MFEELYYWMYYILKKGKADDVTGYRALVILSVLYELNVFSGLSVIGYLINISLSLNMSIALGLFLYLVIIIITFFRYYKKRHNILKSYEENPSYKRWRGRIFFNAYIVLTFVFFILAGRLIR